MRTYSKSQDYWNRLKFALLVIVLLWIAKNLFACSEDEDPDMFLGTWEYESSGNEPSIDIEFTIRKDKDTFYGIERIDNGGIIWLDYTIDGIVRSKSIERLTIARDQSETNVSEIEGLIFFGMELSQDARTVSIDSVIYRKGLESSIYYNQELKKN
jgi:hypothetical protein